MKKSEKRKLAAKEKEWDQVSSGINPEWLRFWKGVRRDFNGFINSIMFNKKPTNKTDRLESELRWWFKIILIGFAFKGVTYWLTGR